MLKNSPYYGIMNVCTKKRNIKIVFISGALFYPETRKAAILLEKTSFFQLFARADNER